MLTLLVAITALLPPGSDRKALHEEDLVFPPESMHNHSSGLVQTPRGDLLVCWFHGRGERGDDTLVIRGARKRKGESKWSEPFVLADNQDLPDQNCVLFIDPRGVLWLFWISSLDNSKLAYLLKYRTSSDYSDNGPPKWAWQDVIHCRPKNLDRRLKEIVPAVKKDLQKKRLTSEKTEVRLQTALDASQSKLWSRLGWMTRTHPIMLSDTRLMLPLYSDHFNCSLAAFTEDWGKTWEFSEPIVALNLQPSFVRKKNGHIVAMMRDKSPYDRIRISTSRDAGMTWERARNMKIPNPGSSVECIALKNGKWVLVCNDTKGGPRGGRTRLTVFMSNNEGRSWRWRRILEQHDASTAASYPSLIQARDGTIHCTYTYTPSPGETIKHVRFNEAWIRAGTN